MPRDRACWTVIPPLLPHNVCSSRLLLGPHPAGSNRIRKVHPARHHPRLPRPHNRNVHPVFQPTSNRTRNPNLATIPNLHKLPARPFRPYPPCILPRTQPHSRRRQTVPRHLLPKHHIHRILPPRHPLSRLIPALHPLLPAPPPNPHRPLRPPPLPHPALPHTLFRQGNAFLLAIRLPSLLLRNAALLRRSNVGSEARRTDEGQFVQGHGCDCPGDTGSGTGGDVCGGLGLEGGRDGEGCV